MFKRLSGPTGEIAEVSAIRADDTAERIVRSAILVHSGPNGKRMTLASSDGDITFDEKRIKNVVDNHNTMIAKLAAQYGGFDKMPVGAYPPILDQHSDDSNDRIRGRLAGLLRFEKRNVPKIGNDVACAVCDITFLGRDTVEQVLDGRIYHLSVGIDESTDTLGETSTVIEPAAPGAMVLKKRRVEIEKKLKGEKKMSVKTLAKLTALKGELKQLKTKSTETKKRVQLAKRKSEVGSRFTKLMADKKMTPAEFKKLDITRLAKLDKNSFDDVMSIYDARESLVTSGQQGSTTAANFSDVGAKATEDREVKRLKAAAKKNLSKQGVKFRLSADDEDEKDLSADDDKKDEKKLSDEKKDDEKKLTEGEPDGEVQEKEEMQQQIEEQATQIARISSMVETLIDEVHGESEPDKADEEKSELESDDDDDKELEKSDDDDKDKKDLDKDKEKEKDKKEENE